MKFFKLEDCELRVIRYENVTFNSDHNLISLDKANALLAERGKVVYGAHGPKGDASDIAEWDIGGVYCDNFKHTHRALLINIEPLEAEDSAESLLKEYLIEYERFLRGEGDHIPVTPWVIRVQALLAKKGE